MGWAIPAAIGAQRVRPDRVVVSVTGDGCFLMSAIEMSTAARAGPAGQVLRPRRRRLPLHADAPGTRLPPDDRHRDRPDRLRGVRPGCGPGLQPDRAATPRSAGSRRALATPGPVLTRVIISYEGREIRWLNALKSTYLKRLPNDQKVRMASRVGVRTLQRQPGRRLIHATAAEASQGLASDTEFDSGTTLPGPACALASFRRREGLLQRATPRAGFARVIGPYSFSIPAIRLALWLRFVADLSRGCCDVQHHNPAGPEEVPGDFFRKPWVKSEEFDATEEL